MSQCSSPFRSGCQTHFHRGPQKHYGCFEWAYISTSVITSMEKYVWSFIVTNIFHSSGGGIHTSLSKNNIFLYESQKLLDERTHNATCNKPPKKGLF